MQNPAAMPPLMRIPSHIRVVLRACVIAGLAMAASPLAAVAAPVTYLFDSGAATVTVSAGTHTVGTALLRMDGLFVTFDDELPALVDFRFTTAPSGAIALVTPYGGYDEIQVISSALAPAAGYANNGTSHLGGGDYFVSVAPVETSGVFGARDSTSVLPDIVAQAFSFTHATPLIASLSISNGTLELTGITLAILPPAVGEGDGLVIKADVTWSGGAVPIPEPSSIALALAGSLLVGLAVRRAR